MAAAARSDSTKASAVATTSFGDLYDFPSELFADGADMSSVSLSAAALASFRAESDPVAAAAAAAAIEASQAEDGAEDNVAGGPSADRSSLSSRTSKGDKILEMADTSSAAIREIVTKIEEARANAKARAERFGETYKEQLWESFLTKKELVRLIRQRKPAAVVKGKKASMGFVCLLMRCSRLRIRVCVLGEEGGGEGKGALGDAIAQLPLMPCYPCRRSCSPVWRGRDG